LSRKEKAHNYVGAGSLEEKGRTEITGSTEGERAADLGGKESGGTWGKRRKPNPLRGLKGFGRYRQT